MLTQFNFIPNNIKIDKLRSPEKKTNLESSKKITWFPVLVVVFAVLYNAFLAFTNAHIIPVRASHVAIVEILLIFITAIWAFHKEPVQAIPWATYLGAVVFIFICTYFFSLAMGHATSLKPFRDLLIICVFGMLGSSVAGNIEYAKKIFIILCICEITFLLMENFAVEWFVKIFEITKYYLSTRSSNIELQDRVAQAKGLFFTAGSFEGRFTLGFRTAQRLSSIFLEPTTHANFGVLTMIFVMTFWNKLTKVQRTIFFATSILIVLGTDSRQLLAMLCILIGMKIFGWHKLPRATLLIYIPFALLVMIAFFYDPSAPRMDNIVGRLTYSTNRLLSIPLIAWFGGSQGVQIFDSGYTYLTYAHSVFGALLFWVVLARMPAYFTSEQRYFAHAVMMFFTINLAVSGSTIFSIKTSAILWFLVGILRYQPKDMEEKTKDTKKSKHKRYKFLYKTHAILFATMFLVFTSASSIAHETKSSVPLSIKKALSKGISVPYWIESEEDPDIPAGRFQELKNIGITHIRIPVNPLFLIENRDRALVLLDKAIKRINDAGLLAIVDFHPRSAFFKKYPQNLPSTQHFIVLLWKDLASHLDKTTSEEKVVFELYNEPVVSDNKWPNIEKNLVREVRAKAPKHTFIIGSNHYNSYLELYNLPILSDKNIVYAFHYYNPSVFTRQGAPWSSGYSDISGITFPPQKNNDLMQQVKNLEENGYSEISRKLIGYLLYHPDIEKEISSVFAALGEWSKKNDITLIMSEFGVVDTAPPEDRVRWIKTIRTQAEKNGIGWSMWSYRGTYGLYKKDIDGIDRLNIDIANALGLYYL